MGFLKKIKFWKKRNNNTPTKVDACVSTDDPRTCDAATVSIYQTVMCFAHTQTETRMDGGGGVGASKEEYQSELEMKNKIRELEEELAVSKRLTADLMLKINTVEQQLRKYAEEPVIIWSDDCECKQQVSAVADFLKNIVITDRDAKNSKPHATSGRKTTLDSETQTEENGYQRDCVSAQQETVRRLEDKNGELSVLVQEYERKIVLFNEEMEFRLRDRTSQFHRIKQRYEEENRALLCKIRDMRDEIISLKERRPPTTERDTEDHQKYKRSHHTGRREAGDNSNGEQSTNQRHHRNERNFGRKTNLQPRLQNRNLPPRLQKRNLPPRLQKAPFCYGEEIQRQMLKIRDMRDELLWYKKQLPVAHTRVQLHDSSSYINGDCVDCTSVNEKYHEASVELKWSEVASGRRKTRSHTRHSESKPVTVAHNRYEVLNNC
jgi:hypothetical protein